MRFSTSLKIFSILTITACLFYFIHLFYYPHARKASDQSTFSISHTMLNQNEADRFPLKMQSLIAHGQSTLGMGGDSQFVIGNSGFYSMGTWLDLASSSTLKKWKYVSRYDSAGKILWHVPLERDYLTYDQNTLSLRKMCVDKDENVYVWAYRFLELTPESSFFLGRWIPWGKRTIIFSYNPQGKLRWVRFLDANYYSNHSFSIQGKYLYLVSETDKKPDSLSMYYLNPANGRIVKTIRSDKVANHTVYVDQEGMMAIEWEWDYRNYRNRFSFSLDRLDLSGQIIWSKTQDVYFDFDINQYPGLSIDSINIIRNSTHYIFGGTVITSGDMDLLKEQLEPRQSFIMTIKLDGTLEWIDKSKPEEDVSIEAMTCDNDMIYLVGETTSDCFQTDINSFQAKRRSDLSKYVRALRLNGTQSWASFLGGSEDKAYFIDENQRKQRIELPNSFIFREDNKLILAFHTQSRDFKVVNAPARNFISRNNNYDHERSYAVIAVFNTQGEIDWSSYITTDAQQDLLVQQGQISGYYKDLIVKERIVGFTLHKKQIHIYLHTNNPQTLLYRSPLSTIPDCEKSLYSPFPLHLLSVFDLE